MENIVFRGCQKFIHLDIDLNVEVDEKIFLNSDPDVLNIILDSLMDNSIKYQSEDRKCVINISPHLNLENIEIVFQDNTQQFLGTLVANQVNQNRIKNDERGISTVETFKKSNKLKKGKGGKGTGGKRLEDRFYPKDEWNRLTQEQRNKVTEIARERKKRAGDSAYSKRKTATAESSNRNENTDAKASLGENGGNEFGQSAHKKEGTSQQSS